MFGLIVSYLLLVFVLPVTLSAVVTWRSLPQGRACPQCGGDTLRLRRRLLRVVAVVHPHAMLHRRWCLSCGWEGMTRLPKTSRRIPRVSRFTPHAQPLRRTPTQTLSVGSVQVDGSPWRVMLQCWTATGLVYGRLVFIAPDGRLWLDAVEAFNGRDPNEALGHAQSLPEPLLARRVRRLVSG